jgi:ABC-2 type transport system permease protein
MNPFTGIRKSFEIKHFLFPKTVIARFVARRSIKGAVAWAVVFGIFVSAKAIGFVDAFPSSAAREKVFGSLGNNIGIEVILGRAPHDSSIGAYVAWNTLIIIAIIGSIWALMLATKYFRGEEDTGRWELLLAGQTTARKAALNNLGGLVTSLAAFFVVISAIFILLGRSNRLDFTLSSCLFFGFSITLGIMMFLLVGALSSQLMPTRSRAAFIASTVLGLSFVLRVIGDITSFHWFLNISPLGWVENLNPLSRSHPLWLLPIAGTCLLLGILTVYFAGKRDMGASQFADRDSSKGKFRSLNSVVGFSSRITRTSSISWLVAIGAFAFFFGLLTKSAAQAFGQSASGKHLLGKLVHQAQLSTVLTFLSLVLLILMTIIMVYVAGSISAIRREESEGLVDNFLVRPYSRLSWLMGRVAVILLVVLLLGGLIFAALWLGMASQHTTIQAHILFQAVVNALIPAALTLGIGIWAYGFLPRLSAFFAYAVAGWSFLISLLSSGLNINHWILDTSVLSQISLSPAHSPNWAIDGILLIISFILCALGALRFNRRDLESE